MAGGEGFGESQYGDFGIPANWWNQEADMYFNMTGGDDYMLGDDYLKMLFDSAYFEPGLTPDEREDARYALADYLRDEYDVDFDDAFDWDAYREWYGSLV